MPFCLPGHLLLDRTKFDDMEQVLGTPSLLGLVVVDGPGRERGLGENPNIKVSNLLSMAPCYLGFPSRHVCRALSQTSDSKE